MTTTTGAWMRVEAHSTTIGKPTEDTIFEAVENAKHVDLTRWEHCRDCGGWVHWDGRLVAGGDGYVASFMRWTEFSHFVNELAWLAQQLHAVERPPPPTVIVSGAQTRLGFSTSDGQVHIWRLAQPYSIELTYIVSIAQDQLARLLRINLRFMRRVTCTKTNATIDLYAKHSRWCVPLLDELIDCVLSHLAD